MRSAQRTAHTFCSQRHCNDLTIKIVPKTIFRKRRNDVRTHRSIRFGNEVRLQRRTPDRSSIVNNVIHLTDSHQLSHEWQSKAKQNIYFHQFIVIGFCDWRKKKIKSKKKKRMKSTQIGCIFRLNCDNYSSLRRRDVESTFIILNLIV